MSLSICSCVQSIESDSFLTSVVWGKGCILSRHEKDWCTKNISLPWWIPCLGAWQFNNGQHSQLLSPPLSFTVGSTIKKPFYSHKQKQQSNTTLLFLHVVFPRTLTWFIHSKGAASSCGKSHHVVPCVKRNLTIITWRPVKKSDFCPLWLQLLWYANFSGRFRNKQYSKRTVISRFPQNASLP